jgi:hypothetical protein
MNQETTVKVTLKIVAGVTAALVAVGTAGTLLYKASVQEQICLSYERQSTSQYNSLANKFEKAASISEQVRANPFAGFALLGDMFTIAQEVKTTTTQINNTKYAYVKSCTQARFDKFVQTVEIKEIAKRVEAIKVSANY